MPNSSLGSSSEGDKVSDAENYFGRILIIDDEESIRVTLSSILKRNNYYVETAATYPEVRDKILAGEYDALILDIILPDIDGIEVLHEINRAGVNLPTIMLTGAPSLETARKSVKYGAFDYLTKPVDKDVLLNQLKNAVNKKRLVDERNALMEQLKQKNAELEVLVEKRTEELRLAEITNRIIIECVSDIIIITDDKGNIQYLNDVFLDYIENKTERNYSSSDFIGTKISGIFEEMGGISVDKLIENIAGGKEIDTKGVRFGDSFTENITDDLRCLARGVFDENLDLRNIVFIINNPKPL